MPDLEPITREEKLLDGEDLTPITRKEQFIKRIYDKTQEIPEPITREEMFLKKAGEGGGGDITTEALNVTANGEYTAPTGKAYTPVNVNVPLPSNAYLLKELSNLPQPIASFSDGSDNPLKSLTASIVPVQAGSGDPSPTNIRPISGWSGANVSVCGTNVWDEEWEVGLIDHTTGNNTTGNGICSKNYISIKANTNYYAHISTWYRIAFYDDNNIYISGEQSSSNIFTTPTNAKYMKFSTNALYGATYNNDISINYPSTDTQYHAYNGSTYTIDLDGTRYGGKLDVVSGVLTVDRAMMTYDGSSDENWVDNMFQYGYSIEKGSLKSNVEGKSNYLKYSFGGTSDGSYYIGSSYLNVRIDSITSLADFKTYLSSNPLQICSELATPTTFYTQPTSIKSLDGVNNVFASTGDVTKLKYFSKEV